MIRVTLAIALGACLAAGAALAQDYPVRPVRVIVPFTPGTGMDIIARNVGPRLSARLEQPFVIDNRPGASGNLGAELVAKAAPDGYTLMVSGNPLVTSPHLYRKVPFQPLADFAPVSLAAWGTLMLVAYPGAQLDTVAGLVSRARAGPGSIAYGSPGIGTPHHLSMELFQALTGTRLLHVPYKGSAGAVTDVLGGQVQVMFLPIHVGLELVKGSRLKALAVGGAKRHPGAPDLPTLQELGVAGAEVSMWYGFLAPRATPGTVIDRLGGALRAILTSAPVRAAFASQGMDAASSTPGEFAALMRREDVRWAGIIRGNNIRAE